MQSTPGVCQVPQVDCSQQAGDCQQVVPVGWVPDCFRPEYEAHAADELQQQGDAADDQHHGVADEASLLLPIELPAVPLTPAGSKGEVGQNEPCRHPVQGDGSALKRTSAELLCPKVRLCRLPRARQRWAAGRSYARRQGAAAKGMPYRCKVRSRAVEARNMAQKKMGMLGLIPHQRRGSFRVSLTTEFITVSCTDF